LSEAIAELTADTALMARLGRNARAVYESRYTEATMLQSYRQLYLELLSAKFPAEAGSPLPLPNWRAQSLQQQKQPYAELVPSPRQPKGGAL